MISTADRDLIKERIGYGYVKKIHNYLKEIGIVTHTGEPYSRSTISSLMQGERGNHELESAIFKFAYDEHNRKELEKQELQQLKSNIRKSAFV